MDMSDGGGWTALHSATLLNRTDVIECLVDEGADVNRQGNDKDTPLHLAARWNNTEAARLLFDSGADINLKNDHNETPLDVVRKGSKVERLLLQLQKSAP